MALAEIIPADNRYAEDQTRDASTASSRIGRIQSAFWQEMDSRAHYYPTSIIVTQARSSQKAKALYGNVSAKRELRFSYGTKAFLVLGLLSLLLSIVLSSLGALLELQYIRSAGFVALAICALLLSGWLMRAKREQQAEKP